MSLVFNQLISGNPFQMLGSDFYGYVLPWIFTFAVVYGLLNKVGPFHDNKRIGGALAFVIAFFVTGVGGPQMAAFFTTLFGGASVFLAGILVILLFSAMLGFNEKGGIKNHTGALLVVILIGVLLFLSSTGSFGTSVYVDQSTASTLFWLIIIVAAIWFVTREEKKSGDGEKKEK